MNKYFSTFISGFDLVVEKWLKERVSNVDIDKLLDGLVVYKTDSNLNIVKKFPIFNNTFVFLKQFSGDSRPSFDFEIDKSWLKGYKTFRVIFSNENQISKINKEKLAKYEDIILQKTGLDVDRTKPDTEIWILKRNEGFSLVGLRVTQNKSTEKVLQKGELKPQLAYFLNYVSEPNQDDIYLDPFAGYGSIPKARINYFPAKLMIVNDKDQMLFKNLKQKFRNERIENLDALNLKSLQNSSIDKIITDPPWGIFTKEIKIDEFYKKMLGEFSRIIKPNGKIVILTAQKDLMDKLLIDSSDFKLAEKVNILVSGKKASIYKLIKN